MVTSGASCSPPAKLQFDVGRQRFCNRSTLSPSVTWGLLELLRCYVGLAKIPVIIVSAHEARLERTLHHGIFGCIRAPYELEEPIDMVESCMAGNRNVSAAPVLPADARRKT